MGNPDLVAKKLPYRYDLLFDLKNQEQLNQEVEYLAHRLSSIAQLCREEGNSIDAYILSVLSIPNQEQDKALDQIINQNNDQNND